MASALDDGDKKIGVSTSCAYTYDSEDRLISFKRIEGLNVTEESYTYDPEGNRLSKTLGDNTVIYVTDDVTGYSEVYAELDSEGNVR